MAWKKEKGHNYTIWRNVENPALTLEIHQFDKEAEEEVLAKYYLFSAIGGQGRESSPELFVHYGEAIEYAKDWMKKNPKG